MFPKPKANLRPRKSMTRTALAHSAPWSSDFSVLVLVECRRDLRVKSVLVLVKCYRGPGG